MSSILLATVTKVEAQAVLRTFSTATGRHWERQQIRDKTYFAFGSLGGMDIFMVQSETGVGTPGGALITVHKAIEDLQPIAVILVGIAFGLRPAEQQIGEILVSKQIMAYEPGKVRGRPKFIPRGDRVTCSTALLDKFRSGDLEWNGPKVHFGVILSGEKIVASPAARDQLLKLEQEAIGGETEGAGLYVATSEAKIDWILVKAICHWADGHENEADQVQAATNAAGFVLHTLQGVTRQLDTRTTDKAVEGLYGLIERMQERQIRKAVHDFRSVFKETDKYFQALRNEKRIHDALHHLQFWFNPVIAEAKRFPADESSADNLRIYVIEYTGILNELQEILKSDTARDSSWLNLLVQVENLLWKAIEARDSESLEKAIRYLRQVLDLQPSIINTRLNMVAQMIDLRKISEALESIDDKLDMPVEQENVKRFKEGIEELVNLTIRLKDLVYKHDQWQQIDNQLRQIDGMMTMNIIVELEPSWSHIKVHTSLLQTAKKDSMFESIISTQNKLDDMLVQKDITAVVRCFDAYRAQAGLVFHNVDRELKNLCDDLMKLGEPLASLMQLAEEAQ